MDHELRNETRLVSEMVATVTRDRSAVVALDLGSDGSYYFSAALARSLGRALLHHGDIAGEQNMERARR